MSTSRLLACLLLTLWITSPAFGSLGVCAADIDGDGISGSSHAAGDITREIADVHEAAVSINDASQRTRNGVNELEDLTEKLTAMANMFNV